jgi:hypothetical protein
MYAFAYESQSFVLASERRKEFIALFSVALKSVSG